MKHFGLLLVVSLLCKIIDAEPSTCEEDDARIKFNVEEIWQKYQNKTTETCDDDKSWKDGVQKHFSGCRTAAWKFHGRAYHQADTIANAFQEYLTKLIYFANSDSTIVASSSSEILKSLSNGRLLNQSSLNLIFVFDKVLPLVVKQFIKLAAKLSDLIGELVNSFANAVNNFVDALSKFMKKIVESCHSSGCREVGDYIPVLKSGQKLMNILSLIGETLLNECVLGVTQEVYEAVFVLDLVYGYFALMVPGVHVCVTDLAYVRNILLSRPVRNSVLAFQYALTLYVRAVHAVTFPFNKSIKDFLTLFVDITMILNTALTDTLGAFHGADITVKEIANNLKNCKKS